MRPEEQRLMFRGKERDDCDYLDTYRVKERSKVVLIQDPMSIEKRYVEMRHNAKIQTVRRAISDVSVEIDKLAKQVNACQKSCSKVLHIEFTREIVTSTGFYSGEINSERAQSA